MTVDPELDRLLAVLGAAATAYHEALEHHASDEHIQAVNRALDTAEAAYDNHKENLR
jgi:Mn-dependent DtxR family transcriptional regulator